MNPRVSRLMLGLFLVTATMVAVHADDILLNGDFSDGKTHWHGSGDVPDLGGSLVITLKPDKWTVVYQDFSASCSQLQLKVTYTYSDDCTLASQRPADALVPPLTAKGLEQATGMANSIGSLNLFNRASWMVFLASGGVLQEEYDVYPKYNDDGTNPRTYSETLSEWNNKFNRDDLCLAFPPGKGTVTITKIELIPPPK